MESIAVDNIPGDQNPHPQQQDQPPSDQLITHPDINSRASAHTFQQRDHLNEQDDMVGEMQPNNLQMSRAADMHAESAEQYRLKVKHMNEIKIERS